MGEGGQLYGDGQKLKSGGKHAVKYAEVKIECSTQKCYHNKKIQSIIQTVKIQLFIWLRRLNSP